MKHRRSLSQRLVLLSGSIMIPLVMMVIYLIVSLVSYGEAYNRIVKNMMIASSYNFTFREQLDYTMYRIVINEKTYQELENTEQYLSGFEGDRLKNPYQMIHSAKASFGLLQEESLQSQNSHKTDQLDWIIRSLERLERVVTEIENNVKNRIPYRENEKLYHNAVLILTEMTQESIQQYIQSEAEEMELIRQDLKRQQDEVVLFSCYTLILIFTASIWISRKITQSVTRPIKQLCEAADAVAKGDFESSTELEAGDEVQALNHSFNHMKVEIGRLIHDVTTEQRNLRETELKLLQAQINPHFLYNTLDAIVWLAESGQNEQVVSMVTALSEFFRTGLSNGKDFISIREEVSHVEHYLKIQQCRYQDIMEYEILISPEIVTFSVLKLTLQPLVENALYHGIKGRRGKGKILLRGEVIEGVIVFQIQDNGIGMSEQALAELRQMLAMPCHEGHGGFGLTNVNERINMAYGKQFGLDFFSELGVGTTVRVTIPMCQKTKDNHLFS